MSICNIKFSPGIGLILGQDACKTRHRRKPRRALVPFSQGHLHIPLNSHPLLWHSETRVWKLEGEFDALSTCRRPVHLQFPLQELSVIYSLLSSPHVSSKKQASSTLDYVFLLSGSLPFVTYFFFLFFSIIPSFFPLCFFFSASLH